jgi:hypothetical protein
MVTAGMRAAIFAVLVDVFNTYLYVDLTPGTHNFVLLTLLLF